MPNAPKTPHSVIADATEYLRTCDPSLSHERLTDQLIGYLASRIIELETESSHNRTMEISRIAEMQRRDRLDPLGKNHTLQPHHKTTAPSAESVER